MSEETTEAAIEAITPVGGADQAPTDDWRSALPQDIRDNPTITDIKSVDAMAKMLIDTKKMVGSSVRFPTSDAGQEDIDKFVNKILENDNLGLMSKPDPEKGYDEIYAQLGRPETADQYDAVEGVDEAVFKAIAPKAHELGISKKQYEELSLAHAELGNAEYQKHEETRLAGITELKDQWGGAYDEKVSRVSNMIDQLGGHTGLQEAIKNNVIDKSTLAFLDVVAGQLGAEGSPMSKQLDTVSGQTVEEVAQRRDEVTRRLLGDDLTQAQRQDLQKKLLALSQEIVKYK